MVCSPYMSQSWWWISAGVMFFAFKKQITGHISHAAWFSIFLNIINTQHTLFECLQILSVTCRRINKLSNDTHHCDHSAAEAIFTNRTYFLDNPHIWTFWIYHILIIYHIDISKKFKCFTLRHLIWVNAFYCNFSM